jgi:hypothetical protein
MDLSLWQNWDKLKIETAIFILEQSEKKLDATIETAKILSDRAIILMQSSSGILIALLGYAATTKERELLFQLAVLLIAFCIAIFLFSFRVYNLYEIRVKGNSPSNLISDEKVNYLKQELRFIYGEIVTIGDSIEYNERNNRTRASALRLAITTITILVFTLPSYSILWYLLSRL